MNLRLRAQDLAKIGYLWWVFRLGGHPAYAA